MADEKTTVKEKTQGAEQPKKEGKFITFCKNLPRNIATPFKNMWHELKQVTWPTKKDLVNYTCIVLVFMVFMGVVIGLLDMGASKLVTAISSLKDTGDVEAHDHDHDANDAGDDNLPDGVTEPDANDTVTDTASEQPAATETPQPETTAPAEGGSTETPAVSLPTQEQVEQAAGSLYSAASTVLDAILGASGN